MKLFKDVVFQLNGKGQGCPLISATSFEYDGQVLLAKGKAPVQNQTMDNSPWAAQQGYLKHGFNAAKQDVLGRPQTFFPGQTYANFSPQTEQALNLTEQRALAGSPVQNASNAELQRTLNGDYLYGGDGFNAALDAARNRILPDIQSRYAQGGRFGSGLGREAEARALADSFASQYGNERQNQLRAMLFAPQAAASDYADMQALAGVGAQREGQAQSGIDEAMARHQFEQMEPQQRLQAYMSLIGGQYGGQQTGQIVGMSGNRGAGVLGGALGGATIGAQVGGPWGAAAGGILGGVTSLF